MELSIKGRFRAQVASIAEAVKLFSKERDDSFEGASTWPDGVIKDGKTKYRISYNGRVWTKPKGGSEIEVKY